MDSAADKERNLVEFTTLMELGFAFYPVDFKARDSFGNSALHNAVKAANTSVVSWLLESKANVNLRNNLGNTPLHIAFANDDLRVII